MMSQIGTRRLFHGAAWSGAVVLAVLGYQAFSQEPSGVSSDSRSGQPVKVEMIPDNGVMLGDGDVRFGVSIEPEGGAIFTHWRNHRVIHIDSQGRWRELDIRLKHQHVGRSIPPGGLIVLEDMQGDYYAVAADGRVTQLTEIR